MTSFFDENVYRILSGLRRLAEIDDFNLYLLKKIISARKLKGVEVDNVVKFSDRIAQTVFDDKQYKWESNGSGQFP